MKKFSTHTYLKLLGTCCLLLTAFACRLSAQYFGGFSGGLRWKSIESEHVRVIYPSGLEFKARRVADDIEYIIAKKHAGLDFKLRKIDLVLNSQSGESNGYVTAMPYHSMFYLTPPQDANLIGSQDWLDGLAAHEYRHVWQYNQMRSRFCNLFYLLMGDKGWAGYTSLIFPDWYFEGDAVINETFFTESGRGRLPYFSLTERAMSLDSVEYSYMKVRNGSYVDLLPDHYSFGYNLLAYGQLRYGEVMWRRVVDAAANWSDPVFPFSNALGHATGFTAPDFYKNMRMEFTRYTRQKAAFRTVTPSIGIGKTSRVKSNYYQSCFETDSTLLVLKSSFVNLLAFYRINLHTGNESKLFEVGELDYPCFSYAKGTLVWAETRHDKRWLNKGYSVVKKLDLASGKSSTLTKHTRYFSPALSADGKYIAVVEYTESQQCSIKFIDAANGSETANLKPIQLFGDSLLATQPFFAEDGKSIYFILKRKGRLALAEYHFASGQLIRLTGFSANSITNPVEKGNRIYFSSSMGGQDDIFYIEKGKPTVYRVVNSRVGAYYPCLSAGGRSMVFSNYTLKGFNLQQVNLDRIKPVAEEIREPGETSFFCSDIYPQIQNISDSVGNKNSYVEKDYHQGRHALNFHSWGPAGTNNSTGLELESDNILNNVSFVGGWYYNSTDGYHYTDFNLYYSRFYPEFRARYLRELHSYYTFNLMEGDIIFPFDFSTPAFTKTVSAEGGPIYEYFDITGYKNLHVKGMESEIDFSFYQNPARLQVAPRWGLSATVEGKTGRMDNNYKVNELTAQGTIYLPGVLKTHAASIVLAHKNQTLDGLFLNSLVYARGFSSPDSDYTAYNKLGLNYQLPLCYPEIGINGVFFLQRVRLNLFSDLAQLCVYHSNEKINYKSAGVEFYFDINWFNSIQVPIYVRYSRTAAPNAGNCWDVGTAIITF